MNKYEKILTFLETDCDIIINPYAISYYNYNTKGGGVFTVDILYDLLDQIERNGMVLCIVCGFRSRHILTITPVNTVYESVKIGIYSDVVVYDMSDVIGIDVDVPITIEPDNVYMGRAKTLLNKMVAQFELSEL